MEFRGFEPAIFEFLEEPADNNNRPWFQENKSRYESEVLEPCLAFIRAFAPRLKKIPINACVVVEYASQPGQ